MCPDIARMSFSPLSSWLPVPERLGISPRDGGGTHQQLLRAGGRVSVGLKCFRYSRQSERVEQVVFRIRSAYLSTPVASSTEPQQFVQPTAIAPIISKVDDWGLST
jgi:hypothetical protein